jgi:hypothetical protein
VCVVLFLLNSPGVCWVQLPVCCEGLKTVFVPSPKARESLVM